MRQIEHALSTQKSCFRFTPPIVKNNIFAAINGSRGLASVNPFR
jgi:hypothetical protein